MKNSCLISSSYIGFRWLRYKFYPWMVLAIALLKLLHASGRDRICAKNRCTSAIVKINAVGICQLLNDLLM